LLAGSRDGATEALMLAHGFTIEMLVEMVGAGLATAKVERVVAGGKTIEVARVRITAAGRCAAASAKPTAASESE
jgi:xanthine dehydrogenase molybdopterin-binding subunit B